MEAGRNACTPAGRTESRIAFNGVRYRDKYILQYLGKEKKINVLCMVCSLKTNITQLKVKRTTCILQGMKVFS